MIIKMKLFGLLLLSKTAQQKRRIASSSLALFDSFNRRHNYMRLSLTDRCNLRCTYCMPANGVELASKDSYLSIEEYKRLASLFVKLCKVDKIRLTGGEPTVESKKLMNLLPFLNQLRNNGLKHLAMTTNGLTLKRLAKVYRELGINLLNISLDTLNEEKYKQITRRDGLKLALGGLMAALDCGFDKVKMNCVLIRDFNTDEVSDFVELARKYPIEVRFIEFMPFQGNDWSTNKSVPYAETLDEIQRKYPSLHKVPQDHNTTSRLYSCDSFKGQVGFVSSMSENFCSDCNRLRVTSDGSFKVCLFDRHELSLRDLMRNGANDEEIVKAISRRLYGKKKEHSGEYCNEDL